MKGNSHQRIQIDLSKDCARRLIQQRLLTIDDFTCHNAAEKAWLKEQYLSALFTRPVKLTTATQD